MKRAYKSLINKIREYTEMQRTSAMEDACVTGDQEKLYHLLSTGYNPDKLCFKGDLPLNLCIRHGQKECFGDLLKAGANINCVDAKNHPPLFYAVSLGQHEVLRMLAKNGADIGIKDVYKRNILHIACETRQESIALLLINMSHDKLAFSQDINNYTPLDYALSTGLEKVGLEMMRIGVPVNEHIEQGFIFHSLLKQMENITKLIIQQNLTDLNQDDGTPEKWAPIHYAASLGQIAVLKKLVQAGVELDITNAEHQTALHIAAQKGHSACVNLLFNAMKVVAVELLSMDPISELEEGAGCDTLGPYVDSGGNTVLHYACTKPSLAVFSEKVIKLVQDVEDLPLQNVTGNTPLHYAASAGIYFVSLQLARRWGAYGHVDLVNENGNTALHLAMSNGHREVMQMLLEVGADMDILDPGGNSLLHLAVSCSALEPKQHLSAVCPIFLLE